MKPPILTLLNQKFESILENNGLNIKKAGFPFLHHKQQFIKKASILFLKPFLPNRNYFNQTIPRSDVLWSFHKNDFVADVH